MISLALTLSLLLSKPVANVIPVSDPGVVYSPYNWFRAGTDFVQTPNPGAYMKFGFSGTQVALTLDVSPLTGAKVPAAQYPVVRYSIDGEPAKTVQLNAQIRSLLCGKELPAGDHELLLQYVAGYVFLDFWTPVNVLRVTGISLDAGSKVSAPQRYEALKKRSVLFLGDSITNGDDDTATFAGGITNAVDTQDATLGYPAVVASGLGAEYGIVAYGGASWDHTAADQHTPGLMKSWSMIDAAHSRLVNEKLSPIPDDIIVNMGENSPPSGDDVPKLLASLRAASGRATNIFLLIPFSGRSRDQLTKGFDAYRRAARSDRRTYLLDLGNNPYLPTGRPTMYSVDGQHPLANLHALLGAQILSARAQKLSSR